MQMAVLCDDYEDFQSSQMLPSDDTPVKELQYSDFSDDKTYQMDNISVGSVPKFE